MKVNRITRIIKILTTMQSGRKCSVKTLAENFQMSRRTVFRDLKELQAIGVPYRYDTKKASYTIDPGFFLPPIDLSLQEALSLLILVRKAKNQIQVPFKNSALLAAIKIENNLPVKIRQYCNTALENISTRSSAQAPMSDLDKIFAQLQKAVAKKQKVKLQYHSLFEREVINLQLNPYHLIYNQRAWYVIGYSSMHNSIRTFKLNRIKQLEPLNRLFVNEKDFDLYEYFGRAWSMIPEDRLYQVKLKFSPKVAHNVSEVHWHSTQKTTWNDDGCVTLEFRVDGINEISWWVLGYGDQVQVLAPKQLQKRIVEAAKNMIKINTD